MQSSYDVVIIGGGVTGSSTACFLAAEDAFDGSILVIERDPTYEHAPSARASGGFRQQFSTPENVRIGLYGAHFLKHIDEHLMVDGETPDVGFRERGYLLLSTAEALPLMRDNNAVQRECGADIHFQSPAQLRERFPWLSTEGLAGAFLGLSNEGWVDPYSLLQAYRRKARSTGVDYVADEAVEVSRHNARVDSVRLRDGGRVEAGVVLNVAGARDAAQIAAQVGVDLPVEPRKRCTFVFECREDLGAPPLTIMPNGVAFRPEGRGFIGMASPPPEWDRGDRGRGGRPSRVRRSDLAYARPACSGVRGDQGDELILLSLRRQHPRPEPDHRPHPGARELLHRVRILGPRPAAISCGGARPQRADHVRGVPHAGPLAVRVPAGADRRRHSRDELLLASPGI